jgi:phosphatidylglycerophosphate synthase
VSEPVGDAVIHARPADGAATVAGVPLLVRAILVLQRAGMTCVRVAGADVPADPRIRVTVVRDDAGWPVPHVAVGGGAVFDVPLVQALARVGAAVRHEVGDAFVELVTGAPPRRAEGPASGVLVPASAPRAVVEQALLRGLENPHDGYLDRLLNRHLSRPTTRLLLPTALTPNHVTVLSVLVGIVGGLLLGAPSPAGVVAGVVALVVSGVLDCCDGEMARIRFSESKVGHLLDITGDTLVHASLLGGIAMQLSRVGTWPGTTTLVLLGVGVVGAFAAITWSDQTETRRHRAGDLWENRVLDGVLSPLTTRDWYVFPIGFALAGRLDVLVPAAAWGAQVFWMVVLVLVARVLRRG